DIQGYTLMRLAGDGPGTGAIVEIGSFMGRSTCYLALGTQSTQREKVYAIDHFQGSPEHQRGADCEIEVLVKTGSTFPQFLQNIKKMGVEDYVHPIQAASREAAAEWNQPIRLLFIDGDHSYEASKEDFELWERHVVPGGLIAFHDIGDWPGVTRYYKELVSSTTEYREVLGVIGLRIIEKVPPLRPAPLSML
ncbi:MAG: class I SAM-dependent methyltransferase, partial [Candidatus Hydrogenedentes bacterium]|nr:class I SAM-dependent methyltransferase [Candidatus Hydrogenedentota bacterium]